MKQLSYWGLIIYYLVFNYFTKLNLRKGTPWVCHFKEFSVSKSLNYIEEVFTDYFEYSGLSPKFIQDKTILEIGTGENLGVSLRLICHGAQRVDTIDRFNSLIAEDAQLELYREIERRLPDNQRPLFSSAIRFNKGYRLNENKLRYINGVGIERLHTVLKNENYDIIISRAVLEHVFNIEYSINVMDRLLRPGGVMIHEIDFRDHNMFSRFGFNPLTFLTVKDNLWKKMTSHTGAPNRKIINFYQETFSSLGYDIAILKLLIVGSKAKIYKENIEYNIDYQNRNIEIIQNIRPYLLPRYGVLPDDDLLVAGIFIKATKPT
jgi:SAM-dependent methyltransferase